MTYDLTAYHNGVKAYERHVEEELLVLRAFKDCILSSKTSTCKSRYQKTPHEEDIKITLTWPALGDYKFCYVFKGLN